MGKEINRRAGTRHRKGNAGRIWEELKTANKKKGDE
jgi:hypothetical protein